MSEETNVPSKDGPEPTPERPRRRRLWLGLLMVIVVVAGLGLYLFKWNAASSRASDATTAQPAKTGDMPGMPGMKDPTSPAQPAPANAAPSDIFIAPERRQLIGVKSVPAELKSLTREIRTVGKIAYDETKITHIHTKVAGFVEEVFVDYVGKQVKSGEPLFTIYSPDLVATQQEYLLALKSNAVLKDSAFPWVSGGSNNLLDAARQRLLLWDIAPSEIDALEKRGQMKRAIEIYSPVSGIVTERQAYHHGKYVTPDMDLYTLVDLSTVWALGEVYESDLPILKVGQMAEVELPYSSQRDRRQGKIVFISPILNPKTRTVEVRLEFPNPDLSLRPDMFVNFKLNFALGQQLVVPTDAVLDDGTLQYVFIDKGEGYFEPRKVKVGAKTEEYYAIESGLKSGEQVVTAANFILDSESRLRGAFANMGEPSKVSVGAPAAATQNLKVEILEPTSAKVGNNTIRLSLKDPSGKPLDDAQVDVSLFMPQMGNMAPMSSQGQLKSEGGGVYAGSINVPMAWTWETTVTAKKNGQAVGSVKTTITAR